MSEPAENRRRPAARMATDRSSFRETATDAPPGARVPIELRVSVDDPYAAHRRARAGTGGFYFETGGQSGWGYFGTRPAYWHEVQSPRDERARSFDSLRRLLDRETLARGGCDVPHPCGAFGWLSYDVARELEELPDTTRDERGLPRLQFGVYDTVAAWEDPGRTGNCA